MNDDTDREDSQGAQHPSMDPEHVIPLELVDGPVWADAGLHGDAPPKCGILNVNKPGGQTSHDVVNAVRRASGVRRVGHAGTLDPLATGVLIVCIGSATRVIDDLQKGRKVYRAGLRLGITTTTYDAEGDVVDTLDPSPVTREDVDNRLEAYRGDILQVPPMYSAIHHKGRRLYELAREGIEVEREARPVRVDDLRLISWNPPDVSLEMTVTKGFYVRSLAHDLGQSLGVGAHLTSLERTAVGDFVIDDAEPLSRVVEAFVDDWWPRILHPLDTALQHDPALVVGPDVEASIRFGQQIDGPAPRAGHAGRARAYNTDGWFIGLLRWDHVTERWQPDRVFPAAT